jgi:hypothetical protein
MVEVVNDELDVVLACLAARVAPNYGWTTGWRRSFIQSAIAPAAIEVGYLVGSNH